MSVAPYADWSGSHPEFSSSAVESEPRWPTVTEPWKLAAVSRAELIAVAPRRGSRGFLAEELMDSRNLDMFDS